MTKETIDKPFRIQTPAGYRKYLRPGLDMPSVTNILSATESEKSKKGLRTWQENNPGALEEASKRGSAIHLGCENYLRGLDPSVPDEYQDFWNGLRTLIGLIHFIGVNALFVPIRTILDVTIERLHMYGLLNTYTLVALTSSVKSVASELLLISKLAMLLTALLFPIVVTELASVVSENILNVRNKWRHTA